MAEDKFRAAAKPKSPVLRIEQVRAACGHMTDFEVFNDKKDLRFREQRHAKTAGRPCTSCRQKAKEERMVQEEKSRQEKARKATERAKAEAASPAPEKPQQVEKRLPHGSNFHVAYDAAKKEWTGTLTVPEEGAFTAAATGVFRLLQMLDKQYWQTKGSES